VFLGQVKEPLPVAHMPEEVLCRFLASGISKLDAVDDGMLDCVIAVGVVSVSRRELFRAVLVDEVKEAVRRLLRNVGDGVDSFLTTAS